MILVGVGVWLPFWAQIKLNMSTGKGGGHVGKNRSAATFETVPAAGQATIRMIRLRFSLNLPRLAKHENGIVQILAASEDVCDKPNLVVPSYVPKIHEFGFEVEYRSTVGNYSIGMKGRGRAGFEWRRHFSVHLPFVATLTVHFPDDKRLVIMNAASPMEAKATCWLAPITRNFDTVLPVHDVYDFNRRVFEEDKAIVESQKPENLPLDPKLEAHILAHRSSIAYRRGLRDTGFGRFFTA